MRIVSLLPAATEILYAIGARDSVVGVTHECDFPQEATSKAALIRPRVDANAEPAELDRQVRRLVEHGESVYGVDADLLRQLAPDLIVTQDLCHVCAASPEDLASALSRLPREKQPSVLTFTPRSLAGVWQGIRDIGAAAGRASEAEAFAERLEREVAATAATVAKASEHPRVLCLEWFDPLFVAGHWVPEMVRLAGGIDVCGREGEPSFTVKWPDVLSTQPEVIVLMSCGYSSTRNLELWQATPVPTAWSEVPAVRAGRVYAVDANAHFSRSGPRLAQGVALLASLLHPEIAARRWPEDACRPVRQVESAARGA